MILHFQSPFMEALGWSLIDSLWQMGAVWLAYVAITRNGSAFSAAARHSLAFSATMMGTFLFVITTLLNVYAVYNYHQPFSLAYFAHSYAPEIASVTFAQNIVPYLGYVYFPAVLISAARLLYQLKAANVIHKNPKAASPEINEYVSLLCKKLGIIKKISVWISDNVESPLTLGFLKPVIILPIAVINRLSVQQVEAVLTHEVLHIKRNDYLLNVLLVISEVVLFFNPFTRLLCSSVRKERENCCDDKVIAMGHDTWTYSEALFLLGKYRHDTQLAIAAAGTGKEYLLQRIARMMNQRTAKPSVVKSLFVFFLCLLLAILSGNRPKSGSDPASITAKATVKPAAFYYAESNVVFQETPTVKAPTPTPKVSAAQKPVIEKKNPPARKTSVPAPPEPPEVAPPQEPVASYVAVPEVIEFTMLDQHTAAVPAPPTCDNPQPFVPSSSFYYTEVDTTAGKSIIKL